MRTPEHPAVRGLVHVGDRVTCTVLLDDGGHAADAMGILDAHLHRGRGSDRRNRRIDFQSGAAGKDQQRRRYGKQHHNQNYSSDFHFLVQVSIQSMKFLYQKTAFCGLSIQ